MCVHFATTDAKFQIISLTEPQWARLFKKVQAKKTREIKEINFMNFFCGKIPFFAISNMAKNQFLNWEKV